jgi:hypothetical protein
MGCDWADEVTKKIQVEMERGPTDVVALREFLEIEVHGAEEYLRCIPIPGPGCQEPEKYSEGLGDDEALRKALRDWICLEARRLMTGSY